MQEQNHAEGSPADPIRWILDNLNTYETTASEFLYDHMTSQSGRSLPEVYLPFDAGDAGHFRGRAQILDYALHARAGRVLDFGPGDGWPSLLLAPYVQEVVGVEGSNRRVQVCQENAQRLGIQNARFVLVQPGTPLPFDDNSFDAAVAASSIEQTPDPRGTLRELHRVLRPGGYLRMDYESLSYYCNGREHEVWLAAMTANETRLVLFDRHIDQEYSDHVGLVLPMAKSDVKAVFSEHGQEASYAGLTGPALRHLAEQAGGRAGRWRTQHPSCRTWLGWLGEIGFACARATYDGRSFARTLVDRIPPAQRPKDRQGVDDYLRPIVETVVELEAPRIPRPDGWEPMVTALK